MAVQQLALFKNKYFEIQRKLTEEQELLFYSGYEMRKEEFISYMADIQNNF